MGTSASAGPTALFWSGSPGQTWKQCLHEEPESDVSETPLSSFSLDQRHLGGRLDQNCFS